MMETWLPRKLRLLRVRQGLTLVEAAKKTGVTRATLSELEHGHREPVATTLVKIATGYGVPIEELLEEPAPKATAPSQSGRAEASEAEERYKRELGAFILEAIDKAPTQPLEEQDDATIAAVRRAEERGDTVTDAHFLEEVSPEVEEALRVLVREFQRVKSRTAGA